jgi:hypothetical protein
MNGVEYAAAVNGVEYAGPGVRGDRPRTAENHSRAAAAKTPGPFPRIE